MSGLLRPTINPLTSSAPVQPQPQPQPAPFYTEEEADDWASSEFAVASPVAPTPTAPAPTSTLPAVRAATGMVSATYNEPAATGFDQLEEVGYGGYSRIKLEGSVFKLDGEAIGTSFLCKMFTKKLGWKFGVPGRGKDYLHYTYDRVNDTHGVPLADIAAKWRQENLEGVLKAQLEVMSVALLPPNRYVPCILQIPEQSIKRLYGYNNALIMLSGSRSDLVWTQISLGELVKTKSGNPFHPWAFSLYQPQEESAKAA